ncbi:TDP-fucosamine acetyltransferase [Pelotomaculum schinkii]|uniref:TDP-fucosamine acetyltransferase n=1 Tax=Pelotomaculum schinkii TaxID=78350 RepID=A0A4Y7RHF3_9FIRM|nr:GNAT family N-acetyltransferase [Pelotomaculum schinkii]TEB08223.1 TDP-fucosamine acetyltransferase [Pelotomaculum schinkii]
MKDEVIESAVTFHDLQWDTDFFSVTCAKAILHKPVTRLEWDCLRERFGNYQFISIENRNSEPINAQLIGRETTAFLADVNIQFKKKIDAPSTMPEGIKIYQAMERDERIVDMADFPFSKFTEDPKLARRDGAEVYRQWLINAFGKADKFYAVAKGSDGQLNGYLLHSYLDKTCTVELIGVSSKLAKGGIGSSLMKAVEYAASQRGCDELKVGTQLRNMGAINFYQKCGCKQVGCHQVYHLWNL